MSAPRVSVVTSVFNGAEHLAPTLHGILAQTLSDFELIVIDDGSTDDSAAIIARYAQRDARIRIIAQENRGLTRALIRGCAEARAPLIARHDAGDVSHARRLERQCALFEAEPRLAFTSSATAYVGPRGEPLYVAHPTGRATTPIPPLDLSLPYAMLDGPTHHGAVMFRRDLYEKTGGYRAAFRYGQDWDLWYRLAEVGLFQSIDEPLYTARVTPESISASARQPQIKLAALSRAALVARSRGEDESSILERAALVPPARPAGRWSRASGLHFVGEALRRNGDPRAVDYLRQALRVCPWHVRTWIRYAQGLMSYSGSR